MQAKIIQVIEVAEFVPHATGMKKSYFMADGTKLLPIDPMAPQPAQTDTWLSTDGKIYRNGVEIAQTLGQPSTN